MSPRRPAVNGVSRERAEPTGAPGHPTATETRPGLIVGTAGYMAPEQVRGETADARTDVFALGTVLFELLTQRRPFSRASDGESLLEAVVRRCLAKEPARRLGVVSVGGASVRMPA